MVEWIPSAAETVNSISIGSNQRHKNWYSQLPYLMFSIEKGQCEASIVCRRQWVGDSWTRRSKGPLSGPSETLSRHFGLPHLGESYDHFQVAGRWCRLLDLHRVPPRPNAHKMSGSTIIKGPFVASCENNLVNKYVISINLLTVRGFLINNFVFPHSYSSLVILASTKIFRMPSLGVLFQVGQVDDESILYLAKNR